MILEQQFLHNGMEKKRRCGEQKQVDGGENENESDHGAEAAPWRRK